MKLADGISAEQIAPPARAGTRLWSFGREPAQQSPPFGDDPLRNFRASGFMTMSRAMLKTSLLSCCAWLRRLTSTGYGDSISPTPVLVPGWTLSGRAHVIDLDARKSVGWISTQEWLASALNGEDIDPVEALAG